MYIYHIQSYIYFFKNSQKYIFKNEYYSIILDNFLNNLGMNVIRSVKKHVGVLNVPKQHVCCVSSVNGH